jgi:hypothetical protein
MDSLVTWFRRQAHGRTGAVEWHGDFGDSAKPGAGQTMLSALEGADTLMFMLPRRRTKKIA